MGKEIRPELAAIVNEAMAKLRTRLREEGAPRAAAPRRRPATARRKATGRARGA